MLYLTGASSAPVRRILNGGAHSLLFDPLNGAGIAGFEMSIIPGRTDPGREAEKARGVKFRPKSFLTKDQILHALHLHDKENPIDEVPRFLCVYTPTF